MFRLEKVFQNDDSGYILFVSLIKSLAIYLVIYCFSILYKNTIYDLLNYNIYKESELFFYSFLLSFLYFIFSYSLKNKREYKKNFLSFLKEDILSLFFSNITIFSFFFISEVKFAIDELFLISLSTCIISLAILKFYFNYLHQDLINKNIIQKNIMLIGNYDEIKKIINEKVDKIYVFKCCMVSNLEKSKLKYFKSELKVPIFQEDEDIRSILEYHSLGQIWILNGDDKGKEKLFKKIIKFSVDTLNINLNKSIDLKGRQLLLNKYEYKFYEISKFYGISLFIKILIDKLLSIFFLILSLPILLISAIAIYLEDGYPILFTQNRTGWDGRRFKIYKLRSLRKSPFDKTEQVSKDDKRLLKIGKLLRRYSIDELPQFFNVLNGNMSIVGPRPHMVEHDIYYSSLFYNFLKRHKCNPGLTGWAQVNGLRGATPSPEVMKRRMEYDLWYLNNWSVFLDIYIIMKTFYALFRYKGD